MGEQTLPDLPSREQIESWLLNLYDHQRSVYESMIDGLHEGHPELFEHERSRWEELSEEEVRGWWRTLQQSLDWSRWDQDFDWDRMPPRLVLNTSLHAFVAWMRRDIQQHPERYLRGGTTGEHGAMFLGLEKGRRYIGRLRGVFLRGNATFGSELEIGCDFWVYAEGSRELDPDWQRTISDALQVTCRELHATTAPYHRTEVQFHTPSGDPMVMDHYWELLHAIAKRWPEACEQLGLEPPEETPVESATKGKGGKPPLSPEEQEERADQVRTILAYAKRERVSHRRACELNDFAYGTFRDWRRKYLPVE